MFGDGDRYKYSAVTVMTMVHFYDKKICMIKHIETNLGISLNFRACQSVCRINICESFFYQKEKKINFNSSQFQLIYKNANKKQMKN